MPTLPTKKTSPARTVYRNRPPTCGFSPKRTPKPVLIFVVIVPVTDQRKDLLVVPGIPSLATSGARNSTRSIIETRGGAVKLWRQAARL